MRRLISSAAPRWYAAAFALLLAVGLVLTGLAVRGQQEGPADVPLTAASAAQVADPSSTSAPSGPATPIPGPSTPTATATATTGTPARPGLAASSPTSLRIPALGLTTRLVHLGLNSDGTVAVPSGSTALDAAWFTGSPTPGQVGPALIEAHIDFGGRPGPFARLASLRTGDPVRVTRADGRTVTFTVYRVARFAKAQFPTPVVYGNTEGPELRLITCGGAFNPSTGHYLDNTVAFARMTAVG